MNTRSLGKQGEEIACDYLAAHGYRIETRNYRVRDGEIDIVAVDADGTLVFTEVKTAFGVHAGDPAFWVDRQKQRQIGHMAEIYLATHNLGEVPCRFDVIAICAAPGRAPEVTHYPNAFML